MQRVHKSKVARWYIWFCVGITIAFIGSIYRMKDGKGGKGYVRSFS